MLEKQDYGQLFCEAVDTIVKERLSNIKFDNTILCTVVDIKDKAQGKYMVTYSEAKFEAYAKGEDVFNKGDKVYVQIPGGDWNEQKFITAKKTNNTEIPVAYKDPFNTYIDITGNVIINTPKVTGGLIANGKRDENNQLLPEISADEKIIWAYNITDSTVKNRESGEEFSKYTRLGIQAQFRSWLADDYVIKGSYGLKLRIKAEVVDESEIKQNQENVDNGSDSDEIKVVYYDFVLDSSDMIGNPYAFDTYFQQEKLFNIADIYRIKEMQLQFYQKGNFKQQNGENLPNYEDENLFVKDVYISLGYDAEEFEDDTVMIYTLDSPKYDTLAMPLETNHRKINIRWVHRFSEEEIKAVDSKDKINYNITFYRYKLGAFSHTPQAGVDWIPLSKQEVEWDQDQIDQRIDIAILDDEWKDYNETAAAGFFREPGFNYTWLLPDITLAEESIKAIISYEIDDQQVYVYSNVLNFSNRQEVVSKPTVDAVTALSIVCTDNSYGNYRIYNQGNQLIGGDAEAKRGDRYFEAYFKGEPLTEAESIEWILPVSNTMLTVKTEDYSADTSYDNGDIEQATKVLIKRHGDKANKWALHDKNKQRYYINNYYAQERSNNTIQCKIIKNKITYTATKELTFGVAGTNGSDHTLIIDFDDGITAIPYLSDDFLDKDGKWDEDKVQSSLVKEQYGITARLYNFENKEVDLSTNETYTLEWQLCLVPSQTASALSVAWNPVNSYKAQLSINYGTLKMNQLYMLEAKLTWRKNEASNDQKEVLTAYLPIPIYKYSAPVFDEKGEKKTLLEPSYIGGAIQVAYMSNGAPNYYKDAYEMYCSLYTEAYNQEEEEYQLVVETTEKWKNTQLAWRLIRTNGQNQEFDKYSPKCDPLTGLLTEYGNKLYPCDFYVKNAEQYGIQCCEIIENVVDGTTTIQYNPIWTQPIVISINRYPNSVVNKWDGKTLTLNEDQGYILSTAIAAGKKEDDGSFTGVMLGDWEGAVLGDVEASLKRTGVYGFHHGAQSYAFMEDGQAFIGKSGAGRIHFNGDKGEIFSSSWNANERVGMHLDLDDGHISMYKGGGFQSYRIKKTDRATAEQVFVNLVKSELNTVTEDSPPKYYIDLDYQLVRKKPTTSDALGLLSGWQNYPVYVPKEFSPVDLTDTEYYIPYKYYLLKQNNTVKFLFRKGSIDGVSGQMLVGDSNTSIGEKYFSIQERYEYVEIPTKTVQTEWSYKLPAGSRYSYILDGAKKQVYETLTSGQMVEAYEQYYNYTIPEGSTESAVNEQFDKDTNFYISTTKNGSKVYTKIKKLSDLQTFFTNCKNNKITIPLYASKSVGNYQDISDGKVLTEPLDLTSSSSGYSNNYTKMKIYEKRLMDENEIGTDLKKGLKSDKKYQIFCYDKNKNYVGQLISNSANILTVDNNVADYSYGLSYIIETKGTEGNKFTAKTFIANSTYFAANTALTLPNILKASENIQYITIKLNGIPSDSDQTTNASCIMYTTEKLKPVIGWNKDIDYEFQTSATRPSGTLCLPSSFERATNNKNVELCLKDITFSDDNQYYILRNSYVSLYELSFYYDSNTSSKTYYKYMWDPRGKYYSAIDNKYYIDLGVDEQKIPLSIGTTSSLSGRNFYVEWDGTLHAKNGEFSGHIDAETGTLGDLEVIGTLTGGTIEGTDIIGVTITGAEIHGAEIYFGEGEGYKYDIYNNSTGEKIGSRVYASQLTNTIVGNNRYEFVGTTSGEDKGSLRIAAGDDNIGATSVLALESTDTVYPIVIRATDRVLVRSSNSWVGLQAGNWNNAHLQLKENGDIDIICAGNITINGASVTFSGGAADGSNQHNIYARFAE